jgi:ribonuclease Y
MQLVSLLLLIGTAALAGVVFGYFLRWLVTLGRRGSIELKVKQMTLEAKGQAQTIINKAEQQAEKILTEIKEKEKEKDGEFKKREERLLKKDEWLDKRQADIDRGLAELESKVEDVKKLKEGLTRVEQAKKAELERVAGLSPEEAKQEIVRLIEKEAGDDLLSRLRKLENENLTRLEGKAQEILTSIIQRLANASISEITSTVVEIPSEDVKGKIIGKEGRNIRAFEKTTGVEIIIDETPNTVTLSSFDPVRREIARLALENLIADGRIQPAKIEEVVEKAKAQVAEIIKTKGERAAYEVGIVNFDPRIILILGRLHFRTSYGQNVLQHSIEMAHLAGMLAEELGADVAVARAGALLHDIGKAVDHEVPGTHVEIGRRILEKFGASTEIIKAMQSHHGEYPYETLESVIVQTADAISASRPGARRDTIENYLKRLKDLENIALTFPGIEKSYAIQAGRELRIFVNPAAVSDLEAKRLARNIALRIEQELRYPGEIKVTVIRENRVIEYAR